MQGIAGSANIGALPIPVFLGRSDITVDSSQKDFTVPGTRVWAISWVHVAYTTNATAGDRQLELQIRDGATVIDRIVPGVTQAASLTRSYTFSSSVSFQSGFQDTDKITVTTPDYILRPGLVMRLFDNNAVDASGTGENLLVYVEYASFVFVEGKDN